MQHVDDMVDLMEEGCVHIANSKLTEFVESNFLLDLLINPEKLKKIHQTCLRIFVRIGPNICE